MNSLEVSKIARFCTEFGKKVCSNLSSYVRCSWYSASVKAMYSICMIHSVLILNVPMFKRHTHKLSEQMFKRCSTNRTPVFIYEHNSVTCVQF